MMMLSTLPHSPARGEEVTLMVAAGAEVYGGFDVLGPGPHDLEVTLQAAGGQEIPISSFTN